MALVGAPTAFSAGVIVDEATVDGTAVADVMLADDVTLVCGVTFVDGVTFVVVTAFAEDVTFGDDVLLAGTNPAVTPADESCCPATACLMPGNSERGLFLGSVGKSDTPEMTVIGTLFFDLDLLFFFFFGMSLLSIGGGSASSLRKVRAAVSLCAESI